MARKPETGTAADPAYWAGLVEPVTQARAAGPRRAADPELNALRNAIEIGMTIMTGSRNPVEIEPSTMSKILNAADPALMAATLRAANGLRKAAARVDFAMNNRFPALLGYYVAALTDGSIADDPADMVAAQAERVADGLLGSAHAVDAALTGDLLALPGNPVTDRDGYCAARAAFSEDRPRESRAADRVVHLLVEMSLGYRHHAQAIAAHLATEPAPDGNAFRR